MLKKAGVGSAGRQRYLDGFLKSIVSLAFVSSACGSGGQGGLKACTGTATLPSDAGAGIVAFQANILLIVADDLGYSDIGAFGGEILTPNLDALAAEGQVLTSHHSAATCAPTRAMLFSGTDHHLAGLGTMAEAEDEGQQGHPGYEGYLNPSSLSIAELLRDAGYHTYMAGKWHLGLDAAHTPKSRGFESSFAPVLQGGPHFAGPADSDLFRENGAPTSIPATFFSSNFYTDKLIGYIQKNVGDQKPFFAFLGFTAPHWPLQAPPDYIDRYRGKYDEGYDPIRQRRLARQKDLGIIPADFEVNPGVPDSANTPKWESLTADQKAMEARKMEVYAAMVENLDANVGRIIQSLKDAGRYDDTFVFFESDNGAAGEPILYVLDATTDDSLGNIGHATSAVSYGRRWAEVGATPFRLWKTFSSEGGVAVPAIARLPRQTSAQPSFTQFTHVTDLAPTFLALAGAADPGDCYNGHEVHPITGVSLLPALADATVAVRAPGVTIADELFGRKYVHRDNWKATWIEQPWGSGAWAVYDVGSDRGEVHDLAPAMPDVVSDLSASYDEYATRVGVVPPKQINPFPPGIPNPGP
jgi:arylsulfatase A-like enzyme